LEEGSQSRLKKGDQREQAGGNGGGEPVKAQEGGPGGTSRREMEEGSQSRLKKGDQGEQAGGKRRRGTSQTSQGSRRGTRGNNYCRRKMEEGNQSRLKEVDQGEQTGWKWRRGTSQGSMRWTRGNKPDGNGGGEPVKAQGGENGNKQEVNEEVNQSGLKERDQEEQVG
jgi:hypothetical protein